MAAATLAGMVMTVVMAVLMAVAMLVIMFVTVAVFMAVAVTANVIVILVHINSSLGFICYYYTDKPAGCQSIYLRLIIPRVGLRNRQKWVIMCEISKEVSAMTDRPETEHNHACLHARGMSHSHGHVHENQKAVINRLARAIGHLEKVKRMVENGEDCSDVLVQLAAVRSAIDNTGKVILQDHMRHCMVDAVAAGDLEAVEDLCRAVEKYMK